MSYTEGNKHSRHYSNSEQGEFRKIRTAKRRYVYIAGDKRDNYTSAVSNTQRYKMLGNGFTVDVIAHIFRGIEKRG